MKILEGFFEILWRMVGESLIRCTFVYIFQDQERQRFVFISHIANYKVLNFSDSNSFKLWKTKRKFSTGLNEITEELILCACFFFVLFLFLIELI